MYPTEFDGTLIGGIYVHEPGALLSNFAIALTCLVVLVLQRKARGFHAKMWLLFVACIGLGATGGMVVHGFPRLLEPREFFLLWWVKNSFVPLANYFASYAVLFYRVGASPVLRIALVLKVVFISVLLYLAYNFLPAVVDLALTYLVVVACTLKPSNIPGRVFLLRAFGLALISGVLYLFPFSLFEGWFTHKDAVHVFVIISLILISKAINLSDQN
jgi:hypothetical protein